jgi:3-phenylpropionate/cinnamic acid dioxygenase small subunit
MTAPATTTIPLVEVERFLFREARLADEGRYDDWEALWADDALYWVPAGDATDPQGQISVICDHRGRIALRVAQLKTGKRHAQDPRSNVARVISNIEVLSQDTSGTHTTATFLAIESRLRGLTTWAGRVEHTLVRRDDRILMTRKVVRLVNAAQPLPTMAFLI